MTKKKDQKMEQESKYPTGWIEVDINDLVKADWNYKTDDEDKSEKLKNNIKLNGQIENIIIRELPTGFMEVTNGNHRYDVLKQLGITKVMTFNLGKITESKAKRIAVETNETRFDTDNIKLAELIKEIQTDFSIEDLAETMPYDINELENFSKMLDFDWNQFDSKEEEMEVDTKEASSVELVEFNISITKEVFELWNTWASRLKENLNDSTLTNNKILEFALAEGISSLNTEKE